MGISSKSLNKNHSGYDFEKDIEKTFAAYDKAQIARLAMMPRPTRVLGMINNRPNIVLSGKPPFDIYGYLYRDAITVGAELKASKRKPSLPIVGPDKSGDGIQYHQLDALAGLAQCGGITRIVWNNGGEVGVIKNDVILTAWTTYNHALASERSGKNVPLGAKSISWEVFKTVDYTAMWGIVGIDWLML